MKGGIIHYHDVLKLSPLNFIQIKKKHGFTFVDSSQFHSVSSVLISHEASMYKIKKTSKHAKQASGTSTQFYFIFLSIFWTSVSVKYVDTQFVSIITRIGLKYHISCENKLIRGLTFYDTF